MNSFYKKFDFLILMLCASSFAMAQSYTCKALNKEIQVLQKQLLPDKRLAILEIELKDTLQPSIVVAGKTNLPDAKVHIIRFLNEQKIQFVDSIKLLPDVSLGDKTWGLTTLSVSNLRKQPNDASELVSQALLGTPVKVLDYVNKWYLVQTPEHYIGWMDTSGLRLFTSKEMELWKMSKRCLYYKLTGFAYATPSVKGNIVTDLVIDDLVQVESTEKEFLKIKLPDGRTGYIPKADCISFDDWCNITPNAESVISFARRMMGTPYLWGGMSSKAIDCSGFTKLAYFTQGIILARDASQQALYGDSVSINNLNNFQSGDLLFFGTSAQHVTHVGIYVNKGDFIHASGRVRINSIDPNDPKFSKNRKNVAARRILNASNSNGIIRVKDHPWYTGQH
jgi:hypothetical protein